MPNRPVPRCCGLALYLLDGEQPSMRFDRMAIVQVG
jgi:hypothetical protein